MEEYDILTRTVEPPYDAIVRSIKGKATHGARRFNLSINNTEFPNTILTHTASGLDDLYFRLQADRPAISEGQFWMAVDALNRAGSAAASAAVQLRFKTTTT